MRQTLRYSGPFAFLASVPLFYYGIGPGGPFLTLIALLAWLIGSEVFAPKGFAAAGKHANGFRALVWLYIPLQLCLTGWAIAASRTAGAEGFAALALSVGLTTGVFGMLAAHECIHSGDAREAWAGAAMLTGMSYRHFRIAHLHGHHRWAATEKDAATARLGEGFYAFLLRTLPGQFAEAWTFECQRCAAQGRPGIENRILLDIAVMAVIFAALFFLSGPRGMAFFALQSAVAILVLELFNYVAHYGLTRRNDDSGKLEPLSDRHSWNSSNVVANAVIFNMGRHSYHHRKPAAPYQSLAYIDASPELPAGYAGSILLALAPPLWKRVMDRRVAALGS